jgi:hypothetical protein
MVFSFLQVERAQEIVALEQLGRIPAILGFRCIALHKSKSHQRSFLNTFASKTKTAAPWPPFWLIANC